MSSATPIVASLITLGCSKNLVDAEFMTSIMIEDGIVVTSDPASARVIIVNTCGFIESAKQEAIDTILAMADYKSVGSCDFLLVTGCLAQRYSGDIKESLPEVDAILGTSSYKDIAAVIHQLYAERDSLTETADGRKQDHVVLSLAEFEPSSALTHLRGRRTVSTGAFAYLKISEGCSNTCTFCAIPGIRGPFQSRDFDELLEEAADLKSRGIKEIVLVAQDTTQYGLDLYGRRRLPELLLALADMDFTWIRFMYAYTDGLTDELLMAMASRPNIVKYIDLPIQHASNSVLRRMGRRDTREKLRERLNKARELMPDVMLRTTVMVGFPGETQADVEELLDFIKEIRFGMLGCFIYSPEEGTPGEKLPDRIPADVSEKRYNQVMETQQEISRSENEKRLNQSYSVLIEAVSDDGVFYRGRCSWQAPEVDSHVYVLSKDNALDIGAMTNVRIVETAAYEFTGVSENE